MLKIWGIRGNYRNGRKNVYRNGALYLMNAMECHYTKETYQENPSPSDWYKKATWRIQKWARLLRNVDLVDGKLVDVTNDSTIVNDLVRNKMHRFKSLARILIGSPLSISRLKENMVVLSMDSTNRPVFECFSKPSEREAMVVDSLTKVGDFLNISAQQRKVVRLTICPQVTHHKIWSNALEELLNGLSSDLDAFNHQFPSNGIEMVPQIVSSCLKFLNDAIISYDDESSSWMRLAPTKAVDTSESEKWEDVLEMFNDLINCLKWEEGLFLFQPHVTKLEVMKEGLAQIKDVLIDRSIGYKEARHQESLVQKKLSKTLGHSSKCLFTLLLYYLYGCVRDLEVDICGGIYKYSSEEEKEDCYCLCMGRILTSNEEKMIWSGVKQLDRALGVFKFVWETAGMKGKLKVQGHIWCVGATNGKRLTYRGNSFFVRDIISEEC